MTTLAQALLQGLSPGGFGLVSNEEEVSGPRLLEVATELADHVQVLLARMPGRLGILLDNTPHFVASLVAVLRLETRAVLFSTKLQRPELEQAIREAGVRWVVTEERWIPLLQELSCRPRCIRRTPFAPFGTLDTYVLDDGTTAVSREPDSPSRELFCQFTSGVSGLMRIVPRTYENVLDEVTAYVRTLALGEADTILCPAPLFHAYGLINGLMACLYTGARLVLTQRFLPGEIVSLTTRHQPTILIGVPFMYGLLGRMFLPRPVRLSSYRYCLSAGAKTPLDMIEGYAGRFGAMVHPLYGSTETGAMAVNLESTGGPTQESVGRPIPRREVRILGEDGAALPPDRDGEIVIRSPGTTPGYLAQPILNRATFRDGWFHTGDVGHFDDAGRLYITGRKSTFINVAGLKVDPFEVERALLASPKVRECAVVGTPHPDCGEAVKAFVVPRDDVSRSELLALCRGHLAAYKVPRELVFLDELPRSPTGKVLRKYLIAGEH